MHRPAEHGIWGFALGYFLAYAPYSALTKAMSLGRFPGMSRGISGFELLPVSTMTSCVGMFVFLTAMGWWKHASRRTIFGRELPSPGRWTFLSGLASAAIIGTTTLAYALSGVSIVFMMLLMRGGVLVLAPLADLVAKRRVRWFSWIALALSLGALLVAATQRASYTLTALAAIDVGVYLAGYFFRLRFMSHLAKSDDRRDSIRYFVEEQMVATPAIVAALVIAAIVGYGKTMLAIRAGFVGLPGIGAVLGAMLVGLLSQGTGVFGGLILLDKRENTFCVPVNRASSILAGVVASYAMTVILGAAAVPAAELFGAGLVVAAVLVLAIPPLLERKPLVAARS
jgi:hypothetical protein